MSSRLVVVLAVAVATATFSHPAAADDQRAQAESYFRTGERLFDAGEFAAAASSFEDAYEILPLPAIAFSAAQAYRLAWVKGKDPARLKRAVELYRRYLGEVKSGGRVTDATNALAELEPVLARLEAEGRPIGGVGSRATGLMITSEVSPASGRIGDEKPVPLPLVREVAAGPHPVTVEAAGYFPKTITATAIAGEMVPVEVDLEPMPAKLTIRAEGGARIQIDGRTIGNAPLASAVDVPAGHHLVSISRRGRHAFARELELERGQTLEVEAKLRTTGQRKLSRWVLIGSGVLAVGAGLAGLGAWKADRDAAELDERRTTEGITAAELARYDQLRGQRDQRMTTMWALGGAAGAVCVTGVLLYLFDRPEAEAPPPSLGPSRSSPPTTPVPAVVAGAPGVAVSGTF